ncbi:MULTISPECIES: LacI family DNA-binding transcriptional regulator [unclassified Colwellia]|uniref:LacI family DNA-binding transcriptional regulator n=1 Tax=unclassified Colwellia TaxID=196834 RepID=UPI0015F4CA59|nr:MULTISPECIES: LacI family DNA-binding transcriptional regulator [unclassified Colwellia]MBA6234048.1 LacI family DNA-binding transcriptional regulator [Colwellia sp. MB02u-7]MBA6238030.1 LacI family DNA-binding transcriptional regulator [Colwellia sp. MB02u-11]MBA6257643.1 LacI family DNA-binding transcriptional regulator [Colwellia sp. MB3u-28]MBA6259400.1 LacI family DNA-binding transcriptional regulator [Colwellia sp. MB3u-41]MBA6300722.1 LacI family DNA-binding transcriptional regulator
MSISTDKSRSSKRITLKDVAKKAGVSAITVSRVVNDYVGVRVNVREKVEAAINALGYIPNRSASILASSRSKLIGVLIPSLSNVVFNDVLRGIYDITGPANYQVLLADTHYSPIEEERSIRTLLGQSPEGLIVTGGEQTDAAKAMLKASGVPVVQIMDKVKSPIDINVGFSHFEAGAAVAKMLLAKSYQKIGFIGARMDPRTCDRLAGFKSVLAAAESLDLKRVITNPQPSSVAMGTVLFRELMAATNGDCDAVFCCNDDLALGALHECKKMHINVPSKFGVCGFNDIEMATYAEPSLSSVSVNRYKMGKQAMELIFARLNNSEISDNVQINTQQSYVNTGFELFMRNSTR